MIFWLHKFRTTNIADKVERQRLIDSFVNAVYLYDDRLVIVFNYKDGTKTVSLTEVEGSDLSCNTAPRLVDKFSIRELVNFSFIHAGLQGFMGFAHITSGGFEQTPKQNTTAKIPYITQREKKISKAALPCDIMQGCCFFVCDLRDDYFIQIIR